jgi:aminoglycoside 3-N-acetyltransferase
MNQKRSMSEDEVIAGTHEPITLMTLVTHLAACGLGAGQTVLVHTRLSALGWVVGGAQTVIQALLQVLGSRGTVMMPTQTWKNLYPSSGVHGHVPEAWWPTIRAHWPAYDPATTPSIGMGVVAELFRTWPGAQRSHHPVRSFTALGPQAERLIATHALEDPFGETSPIGQLYALDGFTLLLGTDHSRNTSLHLAEHRADYPRKRRLQESSAILVEGIRQWVTYSSPLLESSDFATLGAAYEATHQLTPAFVGQAPARFLRQRQLVDWAVTWIEQHRA